MATTYTRNFHKMKEIFIRSKRGSEIPVSVYEPEAVKGVLLMAHSFRSQKEEDGRYTYVGNELSKKGILCIAPDFPGNGISKEPFEAYSLTSCIDDLESCYDFIRKEYVFEEENLSLLGYSMGGRIISLFLKRHREFTKLLFWASVLRKYTEEDFFLEQDLGVLKKECEEKGYCDFYDIFSDETIRMSKQFIFDLLYEDAISPLYDFGGEALILQGEKDSTIEVENGQYIYDALKGTDKKSLVLMKDADHGFGLWDGRKEDNEELLKRSIDFLSEGTK